MTELPNIRHLRAFAALAETGSVTRAADRVHLSQPAVTQAIAKLEHVFGGALFERRATRMRLTERGGLVLARVKRGLGLLTTADDKLMPGKTRNGDQDDAMLLQHATVANLRAVAAFAQAGSFSAAARRLSVSEPSVHRATRALEAAMGVALFETGSAGIVLTRSGRTLATYANLALKEFSDAYDEVREAEGRFEGRIAVGTLPLVRTRIIPRAVVALTKQYPKASLSVHEGAYDTLIAALEIGEIDMLVGALRENPPQAGLEQKTLFIDGLSIVARAGHPLCAKKTITASDLLAYPWVVPRANTPTRVIFDKAVADQEIPIGSTGVVETSSMVALRGILLLSDRLTIISRAQISYEEEAGLLTVLPFELEGTERPIGLTTRIGWHPTALQKSFVENLQAAAREEARQDR